jgi:hypothetical protein
VSDETNPSPAHAGAQTTMSAKKSVDERENWLAHAGAQTTVSAKSANTIRAKREAHRLNSSAEVRKENERTNESNEFIDQRYNNSSYRPIIMGHAARPRIYC